MNNDNVVDFNNKAPLELELEEKLKNLGDALVDQKAARIIQEPAKREAGFWFGSGSMIECHGKLYLSGRYRNAGDSRTGLGLGDRGVELVILESADRGKSWKQIRSMSKKDLTYDKRDVLSIEGTCLVCTENGIELYVSTEKSGEYPAEIVEYQKPGTGIWSIDRITAETVDDLDPRKIEPFLSCSDPRYLHVKDPVAYRHADGSMSIVFCTHPYSWSSANSGLITRASDDTPFDEPNFTFFPRGYTWDVAISRITGLLSIPPIGAFAGAPRPTMIFYDGGESLRNLDEHPQAKRRPRGYSCEEIGGLAYTINDRFGEIERLSRMEAAFISPWGTRTSRYVRTLASDEGVFVTWQQGQEDGSQPLVMNVVPWERVESILA